MINNLSEGDAFKILQRLMNEMVFILDADFNINSVNLSAEKTLGYNENEMQGKKINSFVPDTKMFDKFLDKLKQKNTISNFESAFLTKTGNEVFVVLNAERITDAAGKVYANIIIANNISYNKAFEMALRNGYEELSAFNDMLIDSKKELEKSNAKLIELDRLKDNFISMISHELKTPVTAMQGFLSLLAGGAAGPVNDEQKNFIGIVRNNSDRLLRLINELLDMSKIESGTFSVDYSVEDLRGIIDTSINDIYAIIQKKNIKLIKNYELEKMPAHIDSYRMSQAVINLLNNAIKFSIYNSNITINVTVEDFDRIQFPAYIDKNGLKRCKYYRFSIKDEGRGIPAESIEKVFDKFFQVNISETSKPQGIGLGLPITREIILKHGGRIWAASEGEGKGAEFTFIIPVE
jgi:PAS domain S-box-containing protein